MKVAIMQPYFMPYIGYFQLINAVDKFVIYDNIQFTKKGWIHRNRILSNGDETIITLPLKKDSDYLNVSERYLGEESKIMRNKITRKIRNDYQRAPFYNDIFPIIEKIFNYSDNNLFKFINHSLIEIITYLKIKTEILTSSELPIDHALKSQDKVIALCKHLRATSYINPYGGKNLYSKEIFLNHNLDLLFLKSKSISYRQFDNIFIPWLSIIDVMMFNNRNDVLIMLNNYELI